MSQVSDLVQDSKLETRFHAKYVYHIYHESDSTKGQRAVLRREYWHRKKHLGSGGFGAVWLEQCVKGTQEGQMRAVKEIQRPRHGFECNRELEALAKFSHARYARCFVKSFGWFERENTFYLAMEYFALGDLQDYLSDARQPLPESDSQQITFQILEGLHFMHENGFAHRDIKPANILIQSQPPQEWWVKISDFGISKRFRDSQGISTTIKGTPMFMPPELQGIYPPGTESQPICPNAVDMWALGEISHQLLTKRPVFENIGALVKFTQDVQSFPESFLQLHRVSQDASTFIKAVMKISPESRLTAEQALQNTWFDQLHVPPSPPVEDLELPEIPDLLSPICIDDPSGKWTTLESTTQGSSPLHYSQSTVGANETRAIHLGLETLKISNFLESSVIDSTRTNIDMANNPEHGLARDLHKTPGALNHHDPQNASISNMENQSLSFSESFKGAGEEAISQFQDKVSETADRKGTARTEQSIPSVIPIQVVTKLTPVLPDHRGLPAKLFEQTDLKKPSMPPKLVNWKEPRFRYKRSPIPIHQPDDIDSILLSCWALSSGLTMVAYGQCDGVVTVWDIQDGRMKLTLAFDCKRHVTSIAFDVANARLACGHAPEGISLWNLAGQSLHKVAGTTTHNVPVEDLAFALDGTSILSFHRGSAPKLWDLATGSPVDVLFTGGLNPAFRAISRDGNLIVFLRLVHQPAINLVNIRTGSIRLITDIADPESIIQLEFANNGKLIAFRSRTSITIWDITTSEICCKMPLNSKVFGALAFSLNSDLLAAASTGGGETNVHMWTIGRGRQHQELITTTIEDRAQREIGTIGLAFSSENILFELWSDQERILDLSILAFATDIDEITHNWLATENISSTAPHGSTHEIRQGLFATVLVPFERGKKEPARDGEYLTTPGQYTHTIERKRVPSDVLANREKLHHTRPNIVIPFTEGLYSTALEPKSSIRRVIQSPRRIIRSPPPDSHRVSSSISLASTDDIAMKTSHRSYNSGMAEKTRGFVYRKCVQAVHQDLSLRSMHKMCAFSPDGAIYATRADESAGNFTVTPMVGNGPSVLCKALLPYGSSDKTILPKFLARKKTLSKISGPTCIAFNGSILVCGHSSGDIAVWRTGVKTQFGRTHTFGTNTTSYASQFGPHSAPVDAVALSENGLVMASHAFQAEWVHCTIFNTMDKSYHEYHPQAMRHAIWSHLDGMALCPDGKLLALALTSYGSKHEIRILNVASCNLLESIPCTTACHAILFSPNGRLVAYLSETSIGLWDIHSKMLLKRRHHMPMDAANLRPSYLAFSCDSKLLAAVGGRFGGFELWDCDTGARHVVRFAKSDLPFDGIGTHVDGFPLDFSRIYGPITFLQNGTLIGILVDDDVGIMIPDIIYELASVEDIEEILSGQLAKALSPFKRAEYAIRPGLYVSEEA